jgi:4-amino-4-deoxy-L-arabinose transferase-like glycosyltransferase
MRRPVSFRTRVGLIALAAVLVRVGYVLGPARNVKGIGDWYFFHWGANLIAEGHWFVEPFQKMYHGRLLPSAGHPPLWELMLSAVSWLGGTGFLEHRLLGCALGGGTVVLIGLLGRRVGGEQTGIIAAAIAALYPVMIAADGSLMSEGLYSLLIAALLLLAFRLRDHPSARSAAALGAVTGLAALTRSEALALLLLLVAPIALTRQARRLRLLAVAVLAAVLVIAPWTIRNWAQWGRPVLISTNDGTLLAGANCDRTYHGPDVGFWNIECISERTFEDEADQEVRWRSEGLSYVDENLGRLPVVLAARVLRTLDLYQPRRMVRFAEGRWIRADQVGIVAYFLLLPLAFAGGAGLMRARRGDLQLLLAPVALVVLLSLIGYGIPRFRAPAEITIVVLASLAVAGLLERRRAADAPPAS